MVGLRHMVLGEIHNDPSEVTAEEGIVMVDGPDGVAVSLTPDATERTSRRLAEGSKTARGQRSGGNEGKRPDRD